jgi:hypothetical protein
LVCTEQACRRSIAGHRNHASHNWQPDHLGRGDDGT